MWPQGTQALGTMRGAGRNWVRSLGVLVVSEFHIVTLTAEPGFLSSRCQPAPPDPWLLRPPGPAPRPLLGQVCSPECLLNSVATS